MANCTNCNTRLPFFKVGFLSQRKNLIECQNCHNKMLGNTKQLGKIGATVGGFSSVFVATGLLFFNKYILILSSLVLVGIGIVFLGMIIQNERIKLISLD